MAAETPTYKKITDDELAAMLQAAVGSKELASQFWQSLTDFPVRLIKEENYSQAHTLLLRLLRKCQAVAPQHYIAIDKGYPYYWLGMALFLIRDYQTATFFFDAAVTEDLNWGVDPDKAPTPPFLFIPLEGIQPFPGAQKLIQVAEAKVQRSLEYYKSLSGKPSWLPDPSIVRLRAKFLRPAFHQDHPGWRMLAISFISYFLERDYRDDIFELRPGGGTFEPFYQHLFKGCVLFSNLLTENLKKKSYSDSLEGALQELQPELGVSLMAPLAGASADILNDLAGADNRLETAILFTARLRNTIGAQLGWDVAMTQAQYHQLFEMIASACLHAIACLY